MNRQDLKKRINCLERGHSISGTTLTLEAPLWRIYTWMFLIMAVCEGATLFAGSYFQSDFTRITIAIFILFSTVPAIFYTVINPIKKQNDLLWEVAHTDPLTKVFNRLSFMTFIGGEFNQTCKSNNKLSLILLDIDFFKKVNDTYGHSVGDTVLSVIGTVIKGNTREYDMAARYGGEEFVIVLANTDISTALMVAERLRKAVEATHILALADGITISAGVASYPDMGITSVECLIKAADRALYHAKATGRNRVVSTYDVPTEQSHQGEDSKAAPPIILKKSRRRIGQRSVT